MKKKNLLFEQLLYVANIYRFYSCFGFVVTENFGFDLFVYNDRTLF